MLEEKDDVKKKATIEALKGLIKQMMSLEGKQLSGEGKKAGIEIEVEGQEPDMMSNILKDGEEGDDEGERAKIGVQSDRLTDAHEVGGDDKAGDSLDQDEKKDFMSMKKKPVLRKSMMVMGAASGSGSKMKKKMKG